MKQSFAIRALIAATLLAVSCSCFGQQRDSTLPATYLFQASTLVYPLAIHSTVYHCSFAGSISLTIRPSCSNYLVEWKRSYGKWTQEKPSFGAFELSDSELKDLLQMEHMLQVPVEHKEFCRGTIRTVVVWQGKQQQYQRCGCAPSTFEYLVKVIETKGSAQDRLSRTKGIE